ncbi:hypothetical protein ACFVHS_34885 [Streptomyces sp. NPDC057746]|uniref:hypothetical protein n=1 Tax=Streptomyces sp. NPDC057746 TaxID=3346237 RepID=UPI003682E805
MRRYVHHQLSAVVEAVGATFVSAPVAFALGGLPDAHVAWWAVVLLPVLTLVFGARACTRPAWLGGERRDFETAVPLADPDRILPASRESLRRSFDLGFPVFLAVSGVIGALLWGSLPGLWPLVIVPDRLAKAAFGAYWERRHGTVLWLGNVPEQPLGKNQWLYSSVRQPTL